jgi:hypothetical protein
MFYGYLVSGVFSNADLFANYAGMTFYLGLTQTTQVGGTTRRPMFTLVDGRWQLISTFEERAGLLAPFAAKQMNEALNPSGYTSLVFPVVRDVVKKESCPQWRIAFPSMTKSKFAAETKSLELWDGQDYGFSRRSKMISLADLCFAD